MIFLVSARYVLAVLIFFFVCVPVAAQNKNYYICNTGNNNNDGFSPEHAWQTLDQLNNITFKPGDSIFLSANAEFYGNLTFTADDSGSKDHPVVLTSYGEGKATINAGAGSGIFAINTSNFVVAQLKVVGNGVDKNAGSGIYFYAEDSLVGPRNISIINCAVEGFHQYGILIGCNQNPSMKGYEEVTISECTASGNGEAGISSYGSVMGYQHKNFRVEHCKAYNNRGILTKKENHSGNGIVMGEVDGLVIEYCEAYENGADNRCDAGGPVGIWVWMCKNAVIQYCISHDNHTGSTKDGGGFDIDGGSSDCVLQFNYSYNNEGAGYLLAEYGAVFPFTNNTIRFNISENDGRKNGYGALSIWGAAKDYRVTNCNVYNNTFYSDDAGVLDGTPAIITLIGIHFSGVSVANNIFVTKGNANFINADTLMHGGQLFLDQNVFYSYSNTYQFRCGTTVYSSIPAWLETNNVVKFAGKNQMQVNPMFTGEEQLPVRRFAPGVYSPGPASPLRNITFRMAPGQQPVTGMTDLCGHHIPSNGLYMPGACLQ